MVCFGCPLTSQGQRSSSSAPCLTFLHPRSCMDRDLCTCEFLSRLVKTQPQHEHVRFSHFVSWHHVSCCNLFPLGTRPLHFLHLYMRLEIVTEDIFTAFQVKVCCLSFRPDWGSTCFPTPGLAGSDSFAAFIRGLSVISLSCSPVWSYTYVQVITTGLCVCSVSSLLSSGVHICLATFAGHIESKLCFPCSFTVTGVSSSSRIMTDRTQFSSVVCRPPCTKFIADPMPLS